MSRKEIVSFRTKDYYNVLRENILKKHQEKQDSESRVHLSSQFYNTRFHWTFFAKRDINSVIELYVNTNVQSQVKDKIP